jgi:hypothetical protein
MAELLGSTDAGNIEWAEGAQNAYFCTRKGYNVHINYFFNEDSGASTFTFRIVKDGKVVQFLVDEEEESDYLFMRNLYASVGVSASKLGNIADDFFD